MPKKKPAIVQGTLFEHDYLVRTLGALANVPDVALTELIANAWDAGAARVDITIPDEYGSLLTIEDDGTGMTSDEFKQRWMRLGYNRIARQGSSADFPPERVHLHRRAYGRYGLGRHGMLCFADAYTVETWKGGEGSRFLVAASEGQHPFELKAEEAFSATGHGTRLVAEAVRNLPDAVRIREVLAGRFLHDPQFVLCVNGGSVGLEEHQGLVAQQALQVDNLSLNVVVIDSTKTARRSRHHGVAFWVGSRLVGEPSWIVGQRSLADRRTAVAKRHTIIVQSQDLYDYVLPDWTGFTRAPEMLRVLEAVADFVEEIIRDLMADRIADTQVDALQRHRRALSELRPLARTEVSQFVEAVTRSQPTIPLDLLAAAVEAVINLEKSRNGLSLLQQLARLDPTDVSGLDRLLREWTVRDALTVLDEIDGRILAVEALERLSADPMVDELRTLHPLVTQTRWLFGPEFDSPLFSSNTTLRKAAETVFGDRIVAADFLNPRDRPDLIVLPDATVSLVGTERIDPGNGLAALEELLIVELKRGASTIGRSEMEQAEGYVEDLLGCGFLDGTPHVRAFVVGHKIGPKLTPTRQIGVPAIGRVDAITFGQLVRTASARLFRLKDELKGRYEQFEEDHLVRRVLGDSVQLEHEDDSPAPSLNAGH